MVATNAVKQRTGNVSAGTSSFSMIVLEKPLSKPYEAIDLVTTPDGSLVAMVHCNNCTSDINAWVGIFKEYQQLLGVPVDMGDIYTKLFNKALEGDSDCGGLMTYNYVSGEPITGLSEGRPLFVRSATDKFNLANLMRAQLYGAIGVLKIGNDILLTGLFPPNRSWRLLQDAWCRSAHAGCRPQHTHLRDGDSRRRRSMGNSPVSRIYAQLAAIPGRLPRECSLWR